MKFKQNFLLLSDEAFQGANNKLSIIGIFKEIFFPEFPHTHLKTVLVGNFDILEADSQEAEITVDLVDKKGNPIGLNLPAIKLNIPENKESFNFILEIGNMKLEKEGRYKFIVKANNKKIGETNFKAKKRK